jgi:hypothetical protein
MRFIALAGAALALALDSTAAQATAERGRPIQLAVRLKLVNGRITEIEHVINRGGTGPLPIKGVPGVSSLPLGGGSSSMQMTRPVK